MMIERSLVLAHSLQERVSHNLSQQEKSFHNKMAKLLANPRNKVMLIELLDRSFRCKDKASSFELITHTLHKYGIADFFNPFEHLLLQAFIYIGGVAPHISVPFFIHKLRNDTKAMVLDSHPHALEAHIKQRQDKHGITLNINLIGEEVLGEAESKKRMQKYEDALKSPYISYISIKITTIFSQINIIDFDYCKMQLVKRLDSLYRLALAEEKKQGIAKFINLDMEEFRDLELTVAVFMESVAKFDIHAGIVLQAYIPDSYAYLQTLLAFSKERVKAGFKPIKIRFVKGANMESEQVIASQKGWELPTFTRKIDTDSNYKKMLDLVLSDDNFKYIHIGIASHNLFEIAHAYTRIEQAGAQESFSFEMLEGMSLQCSYELSKLHRVILYAPVCEQKHFNNAIAYLVRRLDENTSEDNFMRHFFNLQAGSQAWEEQKQLFLASLQGIASLDNTPRRTQDRNKEKQEAICPASKALDSGFCNERDTDFILPANRLWAQQIKAQYEDFSHDDVYPVIGSRDFSSAGLASVELKDKCKHRTIGRVYLAGQEEIKQALELAEACKVLELDALHATLAKTAQLLRQRRGDLIGIAALECGKNFIELDAEVSEAIDFVEFYPHALRTLQSQNPATTFSPKGIGVAITPWNFPIGISAGSIAATLASGNVCIYKPSSLSMLTGYKLCQCFWDSGISRDRLIFLPASGRDISAHLISKDRVAFCIFTGGEESAYAMLRANPCLLLSAETGGKNATIVSKFADRDSAVKNIIQSAFSNSGQKCSATSLLILEKEVYEDVEFKNTLVDAARSLCIGDAFELKNKLTALCDTPSEKLLKAINELESTESWALQPSFIDDNPHLMTPGIKYGVRKGSFSYENELFAPILSVMKAENLQEALHLANATGYGLTAGLESLDEREWEYFATHIQAGNIYINKPTTGAIVLRQPFGGIKKSAIGFGRKVGVYNYICQFMNINAQKDSNTLQTPLSLALQDYQLNLAKEHKQYAQELDSAIAMAQSFAYHHRNEFAIAKDYVGIRGEDNLFSYQAISHLGFRVDASDRLRDILGVLIGAHIAGVKLHVSYGSEYGSEDSEAIACIKQLCGLCGLQASFMQEDMQEFIARIKTFERVRYHGHASHASPIYQACAKEAKIIIRDVPLVNGRFELLYYYNERALSVAYHRYGNLGPRGIKDQRSVKEGVKD